MGQTTGERFEKALEAIRENVSRAGEKADKGEDNAKELETIKAKRAEIESADIEFKKEFAATEKKLKDAKLPKEILDRHAKFVKHYEDNLAELKANLTGIEQGAKGIAFNKAIQKAKAHLEKTKAPSRHQKLDPNNLPFRTVKGKERAPRLKKEEFERDFPQQKLRVKGQVASSKGPGSSGQEWVAADFSLRDRANQKPILLAYNDIASDVPLQLPRPLGERPALSLSNGAEVRGGFDPAPFATNDIAPNSVLSTPNYQIAQASIPPAPEDLMETSEVQFTQDIQNLAAQLNYSPVKIYEWVRNNIEFVPTYGSIQGADMCLQSRQCNAIDTASLLIALLRSSNLPARYVYGTIEVPIEKVMNWVGGFTSERAALNFIASGGIPAAAKISGGKIVAVRMEHAWVETYIPYGNYRGAGTDQSLKTWIPMDGSFKQYTYTNGFDMTTTVPFSQEDYLSHVQRQNAVHYYYSQIQNYLDANMPDTSIEDVIGSRAITRETYHFLPSTLPYMTVTQLSKLSSIPDGMTAKIIFTLTNPATGSAVSYSAAVPELAGKRLTISYDPASSNDDALISNYGGYVYGVPAYMLNLKPVIKVDGAITLIGEAVTMGSDEMLTIQFNQPASNLNETVQKKIVSGTYYAVGLNLQGTNINIVGKRNNALTSNALSDSTGTLGKDEFIGEYLYVRALMYFFANDRIYKAGSKLFNTAITRTISEGITSFPLTVSHLFGVAKSAAPAGVEMDVAMDRIITIAKNGDTVKEKFYMDIAGIVSSFNEHNLFESIDGYASVSAVKALQIASAEGIPIQHINSSNIGQLLPALQVPAELKTDIKNAVNAGKEITIPQTEIQIADWKGVGYIVKDPNTGSGAYMISGGLGGVVSVMNQTAQTVTTAFVSVGTWVWDMLSYAFGGSVAYAAETLLYTDDIGDAVADFAITLEGTPYSKADCSKLVRMAYAMAGLCIDSMKVAGINCAANNLAKKYNITPYYPTENGATWLHQLASNAELSPYGGIMMAVDNEKGIPNRGDMVFFNYGTGAPGSYNHMGIVIAPPNSYGTIEFIDTTSSEQADENDMNLIHPTDGDYNTDLRGRDPVTHQYYPHRYAGDLFAGFGTVRNLGRK